MNLHRLLLARAAAGRPLRVGLIGAGKFGAMYLAQAKHTAGIHVVGIADLAPDRARAALERTGWAPPRFAARSFAEAAKTGATYVTDDAPSLIAAPGIEIVIEATGNPAAGIRHALASFAHGKHVVMVNVEADALAGPLLARRARAAGVVYSLAYGDQPALICEMVDWCRAAGFAVVAAGKGTKYLPEYHASTPDTVWPYYGFSPERVAAGDFNARMFNSFLDGTKSAIEMAAVANATGLTPAPDGLAFPPCGVDDLPRILRPADEGGRLHHAGQVEVDLLPRARRPPGVSRFALGRLRDVPRGRGRRRGLRAPLLRRVRLLDRPVGPLLGDVQAVPRDRARARHQRRLRGLARRAHRSARGVARRRRRDREARSRGRRDARRRRRLHGVRQARSRRRTRWRCAACRSASRTASSSCVAIAAHATVRWDDVDDRRGRRCRPLSAGDGDGIRRYAFAPIACARRIAETPAGLVDRRPGFPRDLRPADGLGFDKGGEFVRAPAGHHPHAARRRGAPRFPVHRGRRRAPHGACRRSGAACPPARRCPARSRSPSREIPARSSSAPAATHRSSCAVEMPSAFSLPALRRLIADASVTNMTWVSPPSMPVTAGPAPPL